jgi:hypothetical protein
MTQEVKVKSGVNLGMKIFFGILLGIVVLVLVILGGCIAIMMVGQQEIAEQTEKIENEKRIESNEAKEYAKQKLKLLNFSVTLREDYLDGKVAAAIGTIKNTGNKSVNSAEVLVKFKDQNGHFIGEDAFYAQLTNQFTDMPPLKPNYEAEFAKKLPGAPKSWKEKFGYEWEFSEVELSKKEE